MACSVIPKSALILKAPGADIQVAELTPPVGSNDLFLVLPKSRPLSRLARETCRLLRATPFRPGH